MIQIQRREQFTKAAARLTTERQSVRRYEAGLYEVTNKAKGHTYHVRIERKDGQPFGTCTCEAGTPTKGQRIPQVCKHLAAVVIYLRALREMRKQIEAQTLGAAYDGND
jgi:hypothetical protein